jgi:hypothetical protein
MEKSMKLRVLILLIVIIISLPAEDISANEPIGSFMNEYYEVLALAGIVEQPFISYKSLSRNDWHVPSKSVDHPWKGRMKIEKDWFRSDLATWNAIPPQLFVSYNSNNAHGVNDGALWQGRGFNGMLSGGVNLSWKIISATLYPELWFAQNQEFDLMPPDPALSEYSYPDWSTSHIDMPQRFGDELVFDYGFGQSDIRLNINWFTMGFSNENLWFGPAQVNPIIMSNNASGFPHVDIGTRKVKTFIGDIEAVLVWGMLTESGYFDEDESNDYRFFTSLTFGYSPSFLDGLTLGVNRVMYTPWEYLRVYDFVRLLDPRLTGPGGGEDYPGKDDRDQMISLTIDWYFEQAMFEVYLEWARNDYAPTVRWALSYLQHSQGYTLGFRKLIWTRTHRIIDIIAELTDLVKPFDPGGIGPSFYRHHVVIQGYTNLGQVMGASIGPGSNSQFLQTTYYDRWGKASLFFQRISYNLDYYFENFTVDNIDNIEWRVGADVVVFLNRIDLGLQLVASRYWNRNFVSNNDDWNLHGGVNFRYNF